MAEVSIFETASIEKFRFSSQQGELTTEQLWDLTLTKLDSIAKQVNKELKGVTEEESFVTVTTNTKVRQTLSTKLEILKHIIAIKIAEAEKVKTAVAKAEQKRKILEALEEQDNASIKSLSREELLKKLEEL